MPFSEFSVDEGEFFEGWVFGGEFEKFSVVMAALDDVVYGAVFR